MSVKITKIVFAAGALLNDLFPPLIRLLFQEQGFGIERDGKINFAPGARNICAGTFCF